MGAAAGEVLLWPDPPSGDSAIAPTAATSPPAVAGPRRRPARRGPGPASRPSCGCAARRPRRDRAWIGVCEGGNRTVKRTGRRVRGAVCQDGRTVARAGVMPAFAGDHDRTLSLRQPRRGEAAADRAWDRDVGRFGGQHGRARRKAIGERLMMDCGVVRARGRSATPTVSFLGPGRCERTRRNPGKAAGSPAGFPDADGATSGAATRTLRAC